MVDGGRQVDRQTPLRRGRVMPRRSVGTGYVLRRFQARFSDLDRTKAVQGARLGSEDQVDASPRRANGVNAGAPSTPTITESGDRPQGEATSWPHRVVTSIDDANAAATGIAARMGADRWSAPAASATWRSRCGRERSSRSRTSTRNGTATTTSPSRSTCSVTANRSSPASWRAPPTTSRSPVCSDAGGGGHGARLADGLTIGIVTNNDDANAPDGPSAASRSASRT